MWKINERQQAETSWTKQYWDFACSFLRNFHKIELTSLTEEPQ